MSYYRQNGSCYGLGLYFKRYVAGRSLYLSWYLWEHEKCKHSLVTQVQCTTEGCGYKKTTGGNLQNHLLTRHTKKRERRVGCALCSQKFVSVPHMKSHLRTHTDEKPWQCSYCSYESKIKSNLDRHCESVHGKLLVSHEEALYQCNLCEFKSRFSENFERHLA